MNEAIVDTVRLTPTHDGEAALVVGLKFPGGGRSNVQIDASGMRAVLAKAGVANVNDLVGRSWSVLDVHHPIFLGRMTSGSRK